jgi:hypothetical protein
MAEPSFNIESATNGLVLALFLAAALFLGVMLFYVLRDIEDRQSSSSSEGAEATVQAVPPSGSWADSAPASPLPPIAT